jgi:hypothetical protein
MRIRIFCSSYTNRGVISPSLFIGRNKNFLDDKIDGLTLGHFVFEKSTSKKILCITKGICPGQCRHEVTLRI